MADFSKVHSVVSEGVNHLVVPIPDQTNVWIVSSFDLPDGRKSVFRVNVLLEVLMYNSEQIVQRIYELREEYVDD